MSEPWTREQTIIALNLYCKIPFNKVSSNHPDIIKISNIIDRTPNSVKMKIGNFGSFDPELKQKGIVGLANASKLDKEIWEEFNDDWEKLAYESELLISKFQNKSLEDSAEIDISDLPEGIDRESLVRTRVNQNFFRSTILSSYNFKCCITGLSVPELLIASHIIPWKENKKTRLNPKNGLCLNNLHDTAFDIGLITISTDYKIIISKYLKKYHNDQALVNYFYSYENKRINLPEKFLPDKEYLIYHNNKKFKK